MRQIRSLWWPDAIADKQIYRYIRSRKTIDRVLSYTGDRGCVIQAGGHCGSWPEYLDRYFDEVHTWEPSVENYRCLVLNAPSAYAHLGALGADNQPISMNWNAVNSGGHKGKREPGDVKVDRIDDYGLSPGAILLDVEGMELPALMGGAETIERCRPVVLIEDRNHWDRHGWGNPWDWLREHGYQPRERSGHDVILTLGGRQ